MFMMTLHIRIPTSRWISTIRGSSENVFRNISFLLPFKVDIFTNGSGSHHQLRKLSKRIDLIKSATAKAGGVYMYANQLGCDGGRCFYDGCCMVWQNGELLVL
jgi:hypothetical protein